MIEHLANLSRKRTSATRYVKGAQNKYTVTYMIFEFWYPGYIGKGGWGYGITDFDVQGICLSKSIDSRVNTEVRMQQQTIVGRVRGNDRSGVADIAGFVSPPPLHIPTMFYLVGLGLFDERDITLRGLEASASCMSCNQGQH